MPIYEYECQRCGAHFELKRNFKESLLALCPRCKGESRLLFSPVAVIYKGSGFYATDSQRKGNLKDKSKEEKAREEEE